MKRSLKLSRIPALVFIICFFMLSSCSKNHQPSNGREWEKKTYEKPLTIGFSIDTLAIERWQRDLDIFINKAKELGADVLVQNAGNSVEEQNRQLLYLMEKNVDVVVVLPKEADSISDSIQKIKAKGIPVISYDRLALNSDIDLYMTIDSEKVGEIMAKAMRGITTSSNWFYIFGPEEDYNMKLIKQGIEKTIFGTNVIIGHTYHTSGWNYDLSNQEMIRLLTAKKIPDVVICGNDAIADSIIRAINRYYSGNKHIHICGQDADIAACQYIIQGKQDFTVYKPITELAALTAEYAVKLANKSPFVIPDEYKKNINNGFADIPGLWLKPELVTKDNIDKVIINSGFHSYNSVYGTSY